MAIAAAQLHPAFVSLPYCSPIVLSFELLSFSFVYFVVFSFFFHFCPLYFSCLIGLLHSQ